MPKKTLVKSLQNLKLIGQPAEEKCIEAGYKFKHIDTNNLTKGEIL